MSNKVSITFAGDTDKLEKAFSKVSSSSKSAAGDLDKSALDMKGSFDKLDGAAGGTERGLRGLKDGFTGTGDVMTAFKSGDIVGMIAGFTDLAGFVGDFAGPVLQKVITKLGLMTGATAAQTATTGAASASQWSLNAAMSANPIGALILAIGLLIGAGVLLWKNFDTIKEVFSKTFGWIKDRLGDLAGLFEGLPGKISAVGGKIFDVITWPYRTAFNAISDIWNNTVGKLSFKLPDWVPGLGGKGFDMPDLPKFHSGGVVPGAPGAQVPIMALAGERIMPLGRSGGDSGPIVVQVMLDKRVLAEAVTSGQRTNRARGYAA